MRLRDISHHWLFATTVSVLCAQTRQPDIEIALFIFHGQKVLLLRPPKTVRLWTVPTRKILANDMQSLAWHVFNMMQNAIEERVFQGVQLLDTTVDRYTLQDDEDYSKGLEEPRMRKCLSIIVSLSGTSYDKDCILNYPHTYSDYQWVQPLDADFSSNLGEIFFENIAKERVQLAHNNAAIGYPRIQYEMLKKRPDLFHNIVVDALTAFVRAREVEDGTEMMEYAMVAVQRDKPEDGVFLLDMTEEQFCISNASNHRMITQKYPLPSDTVGRWEYVVYDIVGIVKYGHVACLIPEITLKNIMTPEGRVRAQWMPFTAETKLSERERHDSMI